MFEKKKLVSAGHAKAVAKVDPVAQKYPRPKILLIDLEEEAERVLAGAGYNVAVGSFGKPYKVEKSSGFQQVIIPKVKLPNYTEQEIIVIDLKPSEPTEQPYGETAKPKDQDDWWASCGSGVIDPRPRLMAIVQDHFDRVLTNGGIFVVFAQPREHQELILGSVEYGGLQKRENLRFDNWSFLSCLGGLEVNHDYGEEMTTTKQDWQLCRMLSAHIEGGEFVCTFKPNYWLEKCWLPLVVNKYGLPVAGMIAPDDENRRGWIIVLPRVEQKAHLLARMFEEFLPVLSPPLFPHAEGQLWVHRTEYEILDVLRMQTEIAAVQEEANAKVASLETDIDQAQKDNQYIYDLIRETGRPLVLAVVKTLTVLGFKSIVDVDEEMKKQGKDNALREDLQIHDESPVIVLDVKGVGGHPADAEALQAQKHTLIRIKEWKRTDVHGLTVVNHQKHIPPLDRDNIMPFRQEILDSAEQTDLGLMTTWDLYRLARSYLKNSWKPEDVKPVFYRSGRIEPLPGHYRNLGRVKQVWKNAFSIQIEQEELRLGEAIAFEFPVDFEERKVKSLQLNNTAVQSAATGAEVGVQTTEVVPDLREGIRVFRIV